MSLLRQLLNTLNETALVRYIQAISLPLFTQMLIAIISGMTLLYIGNVMVSVDNSKQLFVAQMQAHTHDAARFVSLSMGQAAKVDDIASLESALDSVTDTGLYKQIYFNDTVGNLVIDRKFDISPESAPEWFKRILAIAPVKAESEVAAGWGRLGTLVVVTHPGQAYLNLWHLVLGQLQWFVLVTLAVCLLLFFDIRRRLSSLRRLELQADALSQQDFSEEKHIPQTKELGSLVTAMNRMSSQLKTQFLNQETLIDSLQANNNRDELTGLLNRTGFDMRLSQCTNKNDGGQRIALLFFSVQHLDKINLVAGRSAGNIVLTSLADYLESGLADYEQAVIARRQGCEFAVLIDDLEQEQAEALAEALFTGALQMAGLDTNGQPPVIHMGFAYAETLHEGAELLSEADMALNCLVEKNESAWIKFSDIVGMAAPLVSLPAINWLDFAQYALANEGVQLHFQPVFQASSELETLSYDVNYRFLDARKETDFASAIVLPAIERAGMSVALDQHVLNELQYQGREQASKPLSVKICSGSFASPVFQDWLNDWLDDFLESFRLEGNALENKKAAAALLTFELPERAFHLSEHAVRAFEALLQASGVGLAMDDFGLGGSHFAYLESLPLRYIKIHQTCIRDIHTDKDKQFYIKSLLTITAEKSIKLIAKGVASEAEWETLRTLGISGGQGRYFDDLEPMGGSGDDAIDETSDEAEEMGF